MGRSMNEKRDFREKESGIDGMAGIVTKILEENADVERTARRLRLAECMVCSLLSYLFVSAFIIGMR